MIFWFTLIGLLGGILGGMGMGGGMILIPLLTFLDLTQKNIQAINLISFIPMAIVALIFHFKRKLVETKMTGYLIIPSVIFAFLGSLLVKRVDNQILKICFGVFVIALGVAQLIGLIKKSVNNIQK